MEANQIDPRDAASQTDEPTYRVDFWDGGCDTWRLSDVGDVHQALEWAEANRGGRTLVLYAEYIERGPSTPGGSDGTVGLCRLIGVDPTATGRWSAQVAEAHGDTDLL